MCFSGGSISSFASFDCIETPIVHANYRSGVRDSEEVEVWLREFRELRERLEGFPDDQEQVRIILWRATQFRPVQCLGDIQRPYYDCSPRL